LERLGIEAIGFHTTGVGGAIMEKMAEDGLINGILDLTTHEITQEYFKRWILLWGRCKVPPGKRCTEEGSAGYQCWGT